MKAPGDSPVRLDDLDAVLSDAWRRLEAAVAARNAAFRTPVLGTATEAGLPSARVVILRGFDPARRVLRIFTDARSGKVADLEREPRAALLFYDAGAQLQLRCAVDVAVHRGDSVAREAWDGTSPIHRRNYLARARPGSPIDTPGPDWSEDEDTDAPFDVFCVLVARIVALDWLCLSDGGNRRARFDWSDRSRLRATWLVP